MPPKRLKKQFRTCEICGYHGRRLEDVKRKFMAKFPLDEDRCRQWVKAVGKEDLVYVPIEKLHELKYLCGNHFDNQDFNKKKSRLRRSAVPTIDIRAIPLADEMLYGFPCHIISSKKITSKPCKIQSSCDNEAAMSQDKAISGTSNSESNGDKEKLHMDHAYAKDVKSLSRAANIADGPLQNFNDPVAQQEQLPSDSTKNIDSPGSASCTTLKYDLPPPSTSTLRHDLETKQCEDMDYTDMDDFHDAPLSPEDYTPHGSSSHNEHHGISLVEDQQTVYSDQSTGTAPQDSSILDDDPILDLGIDDSVSELLNIASEHPALKKIEVDEERIERVERDQCAALYMELLERICDAFDRIPRFVKDKLPGYDEKVYAQMVQLKIKLKIVIKPLVKECVRVDDPLAVEEHCSDVSKLYGDSMCDAELQEAEKSNFAQSATYNQPTVRLEDDQEIVEIEYLGNILETEEIESLQENRSIHKHKDIHKIEYLEDKLTKKPENTAYKVRTHPSSRVHSGNICRNLKPLILLEDCRRSSNTLHDTALNRNLRGKPTRFIMEDNRYLSSSAEIPHKCKVKMKCDIPRKELNS